MKTAKEILCEVFEAYGDDLQLNITLNPSVSLIEQAMAEYASQFKGKAVNELNERSSVAEVKEKSFPCERLYGNEKCKEQCDWCFNTEGK